MYDPYSSNLPSMNGNSTGWICPRCQKVYAPWVASCSCSLGTVYEMNIPVPGDPNKIY